MKRFWLILATFLGLALQAVPASAALTLSCAGDPCTGGNAGFNYGTILLTQLGSGVAGDSNNAVRVTVTLASGYKFATGTSNYAIEWNVTGNPALTISNLSNSSNFTPQSAASGQLYQAAPVLQGNPFSKNPNNCSGANAAGCFQYAIAHTAGTDTQLIFDVTKAGGLLISNFTTTSNGYTFASRIMSTSGGGDSFYVATNAAAVPEPQTWLMMIAGLGLFVAVRRRYRAQPH
ncbi:MAG TPA: PEP-CTERM sorting domain-containing protein [Rhizomicrobium sp.]|jgi:hypothetical protein|nr:PEP-CTERM sorting domain-containing protein [Rhizomicrobium sp.]